jgi:hypothetical protein
MQSLARTIARTTAYAISFASPLIVAQQPARQPTPLMKRQAVTPATSMQLELPT